MSEDILKNAENYFRNGFKLNENTKTTAKEIHTANSQSKLDRSSFIWYALKLSNYAVGDIPFATEYLYANNNLQNFAKENFDIIPISKANHANGYLNAGDLLLIDSSKGVDIVIFKNYDEQGNLHLIGQKLSSDKTRYIIRYYQYLDDDDCYIFAGLRAKDSFRTEEYKKQHGIIDDNLENIKISQLSQSLNNQIKYIFRQQIIEHQIKWNEEMENATFALTYIALKNNFENVTNLSFNDDINIINIADLSKKIAVYASMKTKIAKQIPIRQSLFNIYRFEQGLHKKPHKITS